MTIISNEFAAELIAKMRAEIESRDETTALVPVDSTDLLIIKLYEDMQQLRDATAFLNGGIKPITKAGA